MTGRSDPRLRAFAQDLGDPAELLIHAADTADFDAVSAAVGRAVARFGRLDAVVAGAGFATIGNLEQGDPDEWRSSGR